MADADAIGELVAELRRSRKYGGLDGQALERVAGWALERASSRKAAAKTARRKLHQLYGAYLPAAGIAEAEGAARRLGVDDLQVACRAVLACHASTRERIEVMDDFFRVAFGARTGDVEVLDLGGGLGPFAIPWMPLGPGARYLDVDVDERIERLVARLDPHVEPAVLARTCDLVEADREPLTADVTFLFKLVPTLEQQAPGAAARLLERIHAGRIVITVSAHSLAGRKRGMREHNATMLGAILPDLAARAERHDFPSETMFVLDAPN